MLKNMLAVIAMFILTACGSAIPKQAQTSQEFYHPLTANMPKFQCVYKSIVTESDKAQAHEQFKKLRDAIYQNWKPPKNVNKAEAIRVYFDITPTCQITNINVDGKDPTLKQSLIIALQNTKLEGLDYQEFKNNSVVFKVK